jgi:diaminohydroxyphosphoribosylaminopyrimidine deaminase/5-amino-6-(5-phosphoribosylamino)uracil reductase
MSLDGRIATRLRESRWITSEASRRDAHVIRGRVDAILVGIGTVLADDPLLTPRNVHVPGTLPVRVVLDTHLRTPTTSNLARTANESPVWILHSEDAPRERAEALRAAGIETIVVPTRDDHVSMEEALRLLGERGIVELLVEGGGAVHGALLDERQADGLLAYLAPVIIGGRDAFPAFGGLGAGRLDESHRLHDLEVDRVGDDLRVRAEIEHVHRDHHGGR